MYVAKSWQSSAVVSDAGLLVLKLFAIAMMVLDHVDTGLLQGEAGVHVTVGRTVFPVFAFVLAYNLARVRDPRHLLHSVAPRMALVGVIAHFPAVALWGTGAPLNVMFTLALATAVVGMLRLGWVVVPALLFLGGGMFVDYGWFGVAAVVLGWWLRERDRLDAVLYPIAVAMLVLPINGNLWAVLAGPVIFAACQLQGAAPRAKWLFYAFYPAHLLALVAIKFLALG